VSTDSGIPDFRGPNGLWTATRTRSATSISNLYRRDAEVRQESWATPSGASALSAEPNAAHRAIAGLHEQAGCGRY